MIYALRIITKLQKLQSLHYRFGKKAGLWRIYSELGGPAYTAKNQYRKFEPNIPRKGIARPQSQFPHSSVCERFIYSRDRSAYSATENMCVDQSWEYINRSQTHECGNWE
jgi:hypothetical protein